MEKISFRLQFQCGEHLFWGGRKLIFSEQMALFVCAETKRNPDLICFVRLGFPKITRALTSSSDTWVLGVSIDSGDA